MNSESKKIQELVREQYENFPYPLGEHDFDVPLRKGLGTGCPRYYFDWYWPCRKRTQDLDILVAGCGTGEAAKVAVHVPDARVSAIDISQRSLDSTRKLLDHNNITNVELYNLPLEDVQSLGKTFDLIYCTGVLHHLPDPDLGLRNLRSVLKDSGSMYLMVYGRYGRDAIYIMQEFFRRLGETSRTVESEDLEAIRMFLKSMPPYHPVKLRMELFSNYDLDDNEIVDLFLHPRDRSYTIPEIYKFLEDNGLMMQKVVNQAHYAPSCSGLRDSPFYPRISKLPLAEQFALGELYRASAVMHHFIACPIERSRESWEIRFDGDNWKRLVPVKNPMVKADPNGLPPGIVTRLFLPGHFYKDIYLYLNQAQVAMIQLVDGSCTLEEIHRRMAMQPGHSSSGNQIAEFFSLMLDHDYLWFRKEPLS